jgi:hypothetical protein
MALRRALEMLEAGEQINDRLYRSTVDLHPSVEVRRWSDSGTRRRLAHLHRARPGWSFALRTARRGAV